MVEGTAQRRVGGVSGLRQARSQSWKPPGTQYGGGVGSQAGFHLRDGDERLPARVRIIDLPPFSPELNPCEQLWDIIKDEIGNRVFATIDELRSATIPALQRYWDEAARVLRLIGREWIRSQANASL